MPISMIFVCDFIEKVFQLIVDSSYGVQPLNFKTKAFAGGLDKARTHVLREDTAGI